LKIRPARVGDVPAIHVYSARDESITLPAVSAYARQIGKPWIVEEFGFPQSEGDTARARDFQRVYDEASNNGAAGSPRIFGCEPATDTISGLRSRCVQSSAPMAKSFDWSARSPT
jgi:hypothetical protein